ncbi:conserved hypothetical protein, partial [Ricinus communis]
MDQEFDRIAFDFLAPAIEFFFQFGAREDGARTAHERTQQGELAGRQQHRRTLAPAGGLGGQVERDLAIGQLVAGRARAASQHCAQARQQFTDGKGFEQIVIGAGVEPADAVLDTVAGSDDQDRQQGMGAQLAQHGQAIGAGQAQVQQQRVVLLLRQRQQGGVASADPVGRVAVVLQGATDFFADHGVIFDQQYSHCRALPGSLCRCARV